MESAVIRSGDSVASFKAQVRRFLPKSLRAHSILAGPLPHPGMTTQARSSAPPRNHFSNGSVRTSRLGKPGSMLAHIMATRRLRFAGSSAGADGSWLSSLCSARLVASREHGS